MQVGAANGDLLGLAQDLRGVVERFQIHRATLRGGGGGHEAVDSAGTSAENGSLICRSRGPYSAAKKRRLG